MKINMSIHCKVFNVTTHNLIHKVNKYVHKHVIKTACIQLYNYNWQGQQILLYKYYYPILSFKSY